LVLVRAHPHVEERRFMVDRLWAQRPDARPGIHSANLLAGRLRTSKIW